MRANGPLLLIVLALASPARSASNSTPLPHPLPPPQPLGSVLVAPIDGSNAAPKFDAKMGTQLRESMHEAVAAVLAGSQWSLISAETMATGLAQLNTDADNCVDLGCHLQLADAVHARKVLSGTVMWLDEGFVLTLRLVDTRSLSVAISDDFAGADAAGIAASFQEGGRFYFQRGGLLPRDPPKVVTGPKPAVVRKSRTDPKTGLEFEWFAGGSFKYGCEAKDEHCDQLEKPAKDVSVEPFWLGKTEVPDAAYEKCVSVGVCEPAVDSTAGLDHCHWLSKPDYPTNCVTWDQAKTFCHWIGGELPTGEMWEYAAKDGDTRIYPWGDEEPNHERARYANERASPAGQYSAGATPAGLLDMAGNVAEWTASPGDIDGYMQIRGGAFYSSDVTWLRNSARGKALPDQGEDWLGFRCKL